MNPELLIAELVSKLHSGAIDPHGPNTEADVRGIVMKHWDLGVAPNKYSAAFLHKIVNHLAKHPDEGWLILP